ncbi:MAG: cytochrome c1 [Betaproteobacteria bacterium]|nr:cytochrome c1 [Betaproteobacteria bacterium]
MKKLLALLLCVPVVAFAATEVKLDSAPIDDRDAVSIQRGARTFINYCLNCHSATSMRYNRLMDLGLTEAQIKDNLMFAAEKVGEPMHVAAKASDQKLWFGKAPPDLSVTARARGADWLYTYLRGFYRDETKATGWNNIAFDSVAMPHVFWELQGVQVLKEVEEPGGGHGDKHVTKKLELAGKGTLTKGEYDRFVADLVNYMVFMGEPARSQRAQIGYAVLIALTVLLALVYALKREYWKDVH